MSTIGLYDLDFNHGIGFSLSMPLMKAYQRFRDEGHQVIMMKPYEKLGRYNKVFYFKDKPNLKVPDKLIIDTEKGKTLGYGFYGESGITNEQTRRSAPNFTPYDLYSNRIKNKTLYNSIKKNSLVDWREKDFSGVKKGKAMTYVNDRDFLDEPDWIELLEHFDNNIEFIHTIHSNSTEQALKFLYSYNTHSTRIVVPFTHQIELIEELSSHYGVKFNITNVSDKDLFFFILAAKTKKIKVEFNLWKTNSPFRDDLIKWGNSEDISFKDFLGTNFREQDYYNLPYRIYLKQNPKKIHTTNISEHLTFL